MITGNSTKTALATVLLFAAGAAAETDLSLDRSYALANASSEYASLLGDTNLEGLKVGAQIQARYQYNKRDDSGLGDDDTTMGFNMRRVKISVEGKVTDNISGKVKMSFSKSSGDAAVYDAYAKWAVNDNLTLKVGQFKQGLIREENVDSKYQLATERSAMNETFNQDFSQGIQAHFGGDTWRGLVGFTDGFSTDNTAFNSGIESDYAFNARLEMLFGDATWKQFKQFTSFRGSAQGGMLGAAVAFQSMGDTNPSTTDSEMTTGTLDFSYVGDGWNLYAAGVWRNIDAGSGSDADDYGILLQGGMFVSDQDELYARWDAIFPDDSNGSTSEDFNALTFGWNHYFTPESHAAKFTLDVNYYLDATSTSIVSTSSSGSHNLQSSTEDGQVGVTAQMQFLF